MQTTGNTILITGGNSGIGQALAAAFHALGNTVIITGRNPKTLDETVAAYPGMKSVVLDVDNETDIRRVAAQVIQEYPALNTVIHNAGVMQEEDLKTGETTIAEAQITTNLLGPIRLNSALLPHFLGQPEATILTVSSGLAFVPLSLNPTYSATKAAIHSYTQAMRYQLADTHVQVIELVPPYVRTGLQGERQANDPHAMPLDDYIAETMDILSQQPGIREVLVGRVVMLQEILPKTSAHLRGWGTLEGNHGKTAKKVADRDQRANRAGCTRWPAQRGRGGSAARRQ